MKAQFVEFLARHTAGPAAMADMVKKADAVTAEVAALLGALDQSAREAALEMIVEEIADKLGASAWRANGKLPPELLDRARRTFDEAEFLAGIREIEQTGGLTLDDFIGELEQRATPRE